MKYKAIVAFMLLAPMALLAASKTSGNVTFLDAVTVSGTRIPAGDYRVEWQGTGATVQASILQGKTVLVTAPATLVNGKALYSSAIETREGENNSTILEAIDWSNRSLRFDQGSNISPSPAPEATAN